VTGTAAVGTTGAGLFTAGSEDEAGGGVGRNAYNRLCRPGGNRRSGDHRSLIGSGGSAGGRTPCQRWLSRRLRSFRSRGPWYGNRASSYR
jgi:hypothetical protein